MTLLDPNGNERIEQNSTFLIRWEAQNFEGNETLILEVSNDGGLVNWDEITSGTVASFEGQYEWYVNPAIYSAGEEYRMRIRNVDNSALDASELNFQVLPELIESVSLSSPNGGEQFDQNSIVSIEWTTFNFVGSETLFVEYSSDGGSVWTVLDFGTVNELNGEYNWFVNELAFAPGTDYKVRVRKDDFTALDQSSETFEIQTPVVDVEILTIISPTSGEIVEQNTVYTIDFTSAGIGVDEVLSYEYSTNGVIWEPLGSGVLGDLAGKFDWFVDDIQFPEGDTYQLRVEHGEFTFGQSDVFEIVAPEITASITVNSPNEVEQIALNTTYEILWSTVDVSGDQEIVVEYSVDGGLTGWDLLTSGTVDELEGRFNWFVDKDLYDLGFSNKIRVSSADGSLSDTSDDFFEIISSGVIGFNIISPNGGEVIEQNTEVDILFSTFGLDNEEIIVLEFSKDGFNWTNIASTSIGEFNGHFSWFVDPSVFDPFDRYRIRVRTEDESSFDESDGIFEIIEEVIPQLTLTSALGGETIEQNSTFFITWTGVDFDGDELVNIDYSDDGGANWTTLAIAPAGQLQEEYIWFVDDAVFAEGTDYRVRVQTREGTVSSESSSSFSVVAPATIALTLVTPNGAEQIESNSTFDIKFTSLGLASDELIVIEWSTDGTIWNAITSGTVGDLNGSYEWHVDPFTYSPGANYLIRVLNATNVLEDQSDAVFEIIEEKTITLLDPNGGEKLDQNRNFTVSFETTGLADDTDLVIEYSVNGGLFWNQLTTATVLDLAGTFDWFVDENDFKVGNAYLLRVGTADGSLIDESNDLFSVIAPVAAPANQISAFAFNANWEAYPNATSYSLDVSESDAFDSFVDGFEDVNVTDLTAPITGLYHDTKYFYRVRANIAPDYTSPSSNVISVELPVFPQLKADSLALVPIYAATGGDEWIDNSGWLEGKVKDWHGITFEDGMITAIDLSDNNLTGSFPDITADLRDVASIDLSGNFLEGMADLSLLEAEGSLTSIDVTLNKLDYGDLDQIPDILSSSLYSFNPQGLLLTDTSIVVESTAEVTLDRLIGGSVSENQYQWFKDGVAVEGTDPDLGIIPLPFLIYEVHDGAYHVEVTNTEYPGVTMVTHPVELRVSSIERDSIALLALYDAMDGENWTGTIIGWRRDDVTPVSDWTGVVDGGNRISRLNLPGRGLTGDLAPQIVDITNLESFDLSGNEITGLPDMTEMRVLTSANVSDNKLEFDDFERNADILSIFTIGSQDPFGDPIDPVYIEAGVDYPISVSLGGANNQYQWERRAYVLYGDLPGFVADEGETDSSIILKNLRFDNMGTYRCVITNPTVPGLTLVSNEELVIGTVDLQGKVLDSNGEEVTAGDVGMMAIRDFGTRYDSLINQETGEGIFPVGLDGYIIRDVPLGDYIIGVRSDPTLFIQTYYVSTFSWEDADTLSLRDKTGFLNINITNIPVPDPGNLGDGTFSGTLEEDDGLDGGRTLARRRVKKKGCSLRRRRGSGRGLADDEIYDLYAYIETNDEGEFVFGELIPGTYRFRIEFPGIPMDENSFTEFTVSGDIRESNTFSVAATVTPDGVIQVDVIDVLAVHEKYFGGLHVYPNPATNVLNLHYEKLKTSGIHAQIIDLAGNILLDHEIQKGFGLNAELDISHIENGLYILNFIDTNEENLSISTTKFVISR